MHDAELWNKRTRTRAAAPELGAVERPSRARIRQNDPHPPHPRGLARGAPDPNRSPSNIKSISCPFRLIVARLGRGQSYSLKAHVICDHLNALMRLPDEMDNEGGLGFAGAKGRSSCGMA